MTNMFVVLLTMIIVANCLETIPDDTIDEETKNIIAKYVNKIADIEPQFVIHEGLSKVISNMFKQKISTFPLYKISLKIDRNPVKIPWTLADSPSLADADKLKLDEKANKETKKKVRRYRYVRNPTKE